MNYPKHVSVIDLVPAPFKCARDAVGWAKAHGIVGVMSDVSYEVSNIEVLKGNAGDLPLPSNRTSMDVAILLNGVLNVNGVPLLAR